MNQDFEDFGLAERRIDTGLLEQSEVVSFVSQFFPSAYERRAIQEEKSYKTKNETKPAENGAKT